MNRSNPLIQVLSLIAAGALLGLAFVVGAVVIGVLLALGAVAALTLAIRIWWLHRKIRSTTVDDTHDRSAGQIIEGDYTVVDESDAESGRPKSLSRDNTQSRRRDSAD